MISEPATNYRHQSTFLGRLKNTPIAVGHRTLNKSVGNNKVEALLSGKWTVLADFPFADKIWDYSMVNFNGALYLFGGFGGTDLSNKLVVKSEAVVMDDTMWRKVGNFLPPRKSHRSIVINNSIMHIGGFGTQ